MKEDLIVGHRALPQGFEFHLGQARSPRTSLCGLPIEPTEIPPNFYGVESAIEGRWCAQCEALSRAAEEAQRSGATAAGDAPCV